MTTEPRPNDGREGPAIDDVMTVDRRFFEALLAADGDALAPLLHPDLVIVDVGAGDVTPRDRFIAAVADRLVVFERIDTFPNDAIVRRLGDCTVIVGRTAMQVAMPDGTVLVTNSRYTHLFVREISVGWVLASAQGTAIRSTTS